MSWVQHIKIGKYDFGLVCMSMWNQDWGNGVVISEELIKKIDNKDFNKALLKAFKQFLKSHEEDRIESENFFRKISEEPKRPNPLRKKIFERDGGKCRYCEVELVFENFEIDHILPKSRGGKNNLENLASSCSHCNRKKWAKTPEEAGMKLLEIDA